MGIGICKSCDNFDFCISRYAMHNDLYHDEAEQELLEQAFPCKDYEEKEYED